MTVPTHNLAPELQLRWLSAQAQLRNQVLADQAHAEKVKQNLLSYPGYYWAAFERNQQLLVADASRRRLLWAAELWRDVFEEGGLQRVLEILEDPTTHQELLSSSPFTVMRPPLPENDYYRGYERS